MTNILFEYMYRDASNNKNHAEVVFTNLEGLPLADIEAQIRSALNEGEWFKAEMVDLETCFFSGHSDDDHPWHEFVSISEADRPACDPAFPYHRDIVEFLKTFQEGYLRNWDESRQLCAICRQPFTEEEWEDRHDLHEPDCPRNTGAAGCSCDLVVHARCCPICHPKAGDPAPIEAGQCVCCGRPTDGTYEEYSVCPRCYANGNLLEWLARRGRHIPVVAGDAA